MAIAASQHRSMGDDTVEVEEMVSPITTDRARATTTSIL